MARLIQYWLRNQGGGNYTNKKGHKKLLAELWARNKMFKKKKLRNKVDYFQYTKIEWVKQKKEKIKKVVDKKRQGERKTM